MSSRGKARRDSPNARSPATAKTGTLRETLVRGIVVAMSRLLIGTAVVIALAPGLARAQSNDLWPMVPQTRVPEDAGREQREIERKYQATVKNTNVERKVSNDPWRTVRPAAAPAPTVAADRHKPQ
jgi:hypothetical protein